MASRPMTEADMEWIPPERPPGRSHEHVHHVGCGHSLDNVTSTRETTATTPLQDVMNESASSGTVMEDYKAAEVLQSIAEERETELDAKENLSETSPAKPSLQLEIEEHMGVAIHLLDSLGFDPPPRGATTPVSASRRGVPIPPKVPGFTLGCAYCERSEQELGYELTKLCANCQRGTPFVRYCSKECQRKDWPRHRHVCGMVFEELSPSHRLPYQLMPARTVNTHWDNANARVDQIRDIFTKAGTELQTYKMIIDAHRCLDEVKMDYHPGFRPLNFYYVWLRGFSIERLKRFLDRTLLDENMDMFMPLWWTKKHRDSCEQVARMMYQWDDVPSPIHPEVNIFTRYGGARVRLALRHAAARIDGNLSMKQHSDLHAYFAIDAMDEAKMFSRWMQWCDEGCVRANYW